MMKMLLWSNQLSNPHGLKITPTYVAIFFLQCASQFAEPFIGFQLILVVSDSDKSDSSRKATTSHVKPKATSCTNSATARSTSALSRTTNTKAKLSKMKSKASFLSASTNSIHVLPVLDIDADGLPTFARANWSTSFLPTLYALLGSSSKPWKLYKKGSGILETAQEVINIVYPNSGYHVKQLIRSSLWSIHPPNFFTEEANTLLG